MEQVQVEVVEELILGVVQGVDSQEHFQEYPARKINSFFV
jgi:hypothetical protein